MEEHSLIAKWTRDAPTNSETLVGPGDDCAALDFGEPDTLRLFKTDAIVETKHFPADADARSVGHKALARALSDIAAMGGAPVSALITIGIPRDYDRGRIDLVYEGLYALARRFDVSISGGETVRSLAGLWISIAVIGSVPRDQIVYRTGARAGDWIFVTGSLGGSIEGRHLCFEPRIPQASWLAERRIPTSMIDVSDGLASDCRHLIEKNDLGAELQEDALPISDAANRRFGRADGAAAPTLAALTDGEDYELLFTVSPQDATQIDKAWRVRFPDIRLAHIGSITQQPGLRIQSRKGLIEFNQYGYDHFRES